ncbi:MAG: DUF2442 domain-containing protein [Anaerolineales bacterium]|nr:DUF2442 domain-containing protein [Anaerolineales bacterium]
MSAEETIIFLEQAVYGGDYRIHLFFNDGIEQIVDFAPFLMASRNPLIRKFLNPQYFQRFTVKYGDLFWNEYDPCFPIADLYENTI